MVEKQCEACGKTYQRKPCRAPKSKYCSLKCMNVGHKKNTGELNSAWKGGKVKKKCKACGKSFKALPSEIKRGGGVFCTAYCSSAYHVKERSGNWKGGPIKKQCKVCGKTFYRKHLKRKAEFCSCSCSTIYNIKHLQKKKHTGIELKVASILTALGVKYIDQHPIPEGRTVVDFYIPAQKLIIYADGDYWHSMPNVKNKDTNQEFLLGMNGYNVLRLSETEINKNKQKCINKIKKTMEG